MFDLYQAEEQMPQGTNVPCMLEASEQSWESIQRKGDGDGEAARGGERVEERTGSVGPDQGV